MLSLTLTAEVGGFRSLRVNLGSVDIAGFESECLVTGVDSAGRGPAGSRAEPDDDADGDVVHLQPEREVPNGARVY